MDACSEPENRQVVVMAGAQLGKSEAILNIIGYHIDNDPSPILVLQPTLDMAQSFSKDRVTAGLLRSTPCLRDKVKDPRSRDSGNTTLHKLFAGGALTMVGANSPSGLASRPIRVLLCDEVDRYPTSAGEEGDPIQLAVKRTSTFWNRKIIMVSTPTNKGASRIEESYEKSDKRKYHIPCKHCKEPQVMRWKNVKWYNDDPDTACYICEHCGVEWSDSDRRWSIRNGKWIADEPFNGIAGFHISALYSPWTPLADGVRDFLNSKSNPEQLRVWTNTYLGESWEDQGQQIDEMELAKRREEMINIPNDVVFMTAGADVQDNRLEISVIGYGRDEEMYVINHETMYGDPSTPQLWGALESRIFAKYQKEDGSPIQITATCVDSGGHFTNSVYQFCKKHASRRVFAIKGVGGDGKPIVGRPSKNNIGKCALYPVGVDTVKDLVFARLSKNEQGGGYVHFNETLEDEYFKQLTAEKAVTRFHKGFKKRAYIKTRTRNEALDCMVYSIAACGILNVDINTLADKMANGKAAKPVEDKNNPAKQAFVPKAGKNFINSWR